MSELSGAGSDPRQIKRRLNRRESILEPSDQHRNSQDAAAEIGKHHDAISGWIDSYRRVNAAVHVHLFGWRRDGEGPGVDICVGFQRNPERGVLLESKSAVKTGLVHRSGSGVYYVERPVFIKVVELRNIREDRPHGLNAVSGQPKAAVPSTVRLQPLDGCPFAFPERPDVVPFLGGLESTSFRFP